jgi:hypothetical protein
MAVAWEREEGGDIAVVMCMHAIEDDGVREQT